MNKKVYDEVEDFFYKSDPFVIWQSLFGCDPSDTDIHEGLNSSASVALEEAVVNLDNQIDSYLLGADFPLDIKVNKRNISLLRRKLLSAAILNLSAKKASANKIEHSANFENSGIVLVLGDLLNSSEFLSKLGCSSLEDLITFSDKTKSFSPLFIYDGTPSCEIHTWTKEQVKEIFTIIFNEHIHKFVMNNKVNIIDIGVKNDFLDFSPFIHFADYDDRSRLNEIIKHVRRMVDNGEDINDAIARTPFKNTLIQNISYRLVENFELLLFSYGFHKKNNGQYAVSYDSLQDLKPILYRLLGDSRFHLNGIMKKEYVKLVKLFVPMGDDSPAFALVNADSFSVQQFKEHFGQADLVIGLPEAQEMDNFYELDVGNGILLDENTIFNKNYVLEELKNVFNGFEFNK